MTLIGIIFSREVLHPDKYSCEIGHAFPNPSLMIKVLSYRRSLRVGKEGTRILIRVGKVSGKNNSNSSAGLICGIIRFQAP